MVDSIEDALVEIDFRPGYQSNHRKSFGRSQIRNVVGGILNLDSNYVLTQTVTNPEAVEALGSYVGTRESMGHSWVIRERGEDEEPAYVPGARDSLNGLWFSTGLMNTYLEAVRKLSERRFGKDHYAQFPMVQMTGVHSLDVPSEALNWPVIHVLRDVGEERFRKVLVDLNQDSGQKVLHKMEEPKNYKLGEIQTLSQLGIDPLIAKSRGWQVDGKTLAHAVDFLTLYTFTDKFIGQVIYED